MLKIWFCISVTCVKWIKIFSEMFSLKAGVRQGGILSPHLFAIILDRFIDKIVSSNVGCYMSVLSVYVNLYADDILLISPSVTSLQHLLNL